jgi:hypothetical protein
MVAVGLASGAQAWVGPGEGSSANLVVGDLSALSTGDVVLQGELVDMGFEVTLVADESTAPVSPETDVVVLAASTGQSVLGSRYRDVVVPVVAMGMARGPRWG